ncbi:Hypothetical protein PFR_JS8_1936 [Propionibacterium freudenreichii]|nr:Hypothetical protein PFR_JS8_1936 [Propionibacterium freudenreichii]
MEAMAWPRVEKASMKGPSRRRGNSPDPERTRIMTDSLNEGPLQKEGQFCEAVGLGLGSLAASMKGSSRRRGNSRRPHLRSDCCTPPQ